MDINQLFQNGASHSILAPMAGYTDPAFRSICRQFGVGLTVTEMVSSKAIVMSKQPCALIVNCICDEMPISFFCCCVP